MECFDKELADKDRFLMHSGTLSGNPLASTAGLKTLEILERDGQYEKLRKTGYEVQNALSDPLTEAGIPHRIVGDPTLFDIVFTDRDVRNYRDVTNSDQVKNAKYNAILRENGILKPVGKCYPSFAHTAEDLELTLGAATTASKNLGN